MTVFLIKRADNSDHFVSNRFIINFIRDFIVKYILTNLRAYWLIPVDVRV